MYGNFDVSDINFLWLVFDFVVSETTSQVAAKHTFIVI